MIPPASRCSLSTQVTEGGKRTRGCSLKELECQLCYDASPITPLFGGDIKLTSEAPIRSLADMPSP